MPKLKNTAKSGHTACYLSSTAEENNFYSSHFGPEKSHKRWIVPSEEKRLSKNLKKIPTFERKKLKYDEKIFNYFSQFLQFFTQIRYVWNKFWMLPIRKWDCEYKHNLILMPWWTLNIISWSWVGKRKSLLLVLTSPNLKQKIAILHGRLGTYFRKQHHTTSLPYFYWMGGLFWGITNKNKSAQDLV